MTNLGEKMSDEEVDELLKAVDTSSGEINYTGISPIPHPSPGSFPVSGKMDLLTLLAELELVRTILAN